MPKDPHLAALLDRCTALRLPARQHLTETLPGDAERILIVRREPVDQGLMDMRSEISKQFRIPVGQQLKKPLRIKALLKDIRIMQGLNALFNTCIDEPGYAGLLAHLPCILKAQPAVELFDIAASADLLTEIVDGQSREIILREPFEEFPDSPRKGLQHAVRIFIFRKSFLKEDLRKPFPGLQDLLI